MHRSSCKILVVDDSLADQELYQRYLLSDRTGSYKILQARLGEEGLKLWHQHQPDAVLLDYRLPDLDVRVDEYKPNCEKVKNDCE